MEIWIRSQDRENLIKIENITIDNENYVLGNLVSDDNKGICDYWRLGKYKTKERALEVLDDIHNVLKGNVENHINKFDLYRENNVIVYEMPKE